MSLPVREDKIKVKGRLDRKQLHAAVKATGGRFEHKEQQEAACCATAEAFERANKNSSNCLGSNPLT